MKLLRAKSQIPVVSILIILGSYAGLRWSMETTDSLPLMLSVKHLLVHLMSLNQPCCSDVFTTSCWTETSVQESMALYSHKMNSAGVISWWLKLLHKRLQ